MERADEAMVIAERNGWKVIVGVEPDQPESTRPHDAHARRSHPDAPRADCRP